VAESSITATRVASTQSTALPPPFPPISLAWTVWGIGAVLYFVSFYQRVLPAVITSELSSAFGLTATGLGHLSAFYFYSYVALQIPTGILADRFGTRIVLTVGAALAALGTAVFAAAETAMMANMGRLLIGGAIGVAFVAMLKLSSCWMPSRNFALASSISLVIGVAGAVSAGAPLRMLVDSFGWRDVMWASAAFTLLVAMAAWLIVRDDPHERGYASHAPLSTGATRIGAWQGLKAVLGFRNVWLLYGAAGALTGIVLTFAGLWGVPFLVSHYALSQTEAAGLCSLMMVAWSLGCVVIGAASNKLKRRKLPLMIGIALAALFWAVFISRADWSITFAALWLAASGFCAGSFIIVFVFAKESVPIHLAGTVSGVANTGVIQGPMLMQPLVGFVLDSSWTGQLINGKRFFEFSAWNTAFTLVLLWAALSLVLVAFTRETHCEQASSTVGKC
jgi:sugar phosphate permease